MLHPKKTIQKALISTTSRFFGEYEREGVLFTHAWHDFYKKNAVIRLEEGPASRSTYIFAFETDPVADDLEPLPSYSYTADICCAYLSVLFGKKFDNHGLIEENGYYHVPDLTQFRHLCDPCLPFNSHSPRIDFTVPLNLVEISRIERLFLDNNIDQKFNKTFQAASKFYLKSLQNAENDPEIAYLHLITAGEILSNYYKYEKKELLDKQTKGELLQTENELSNGTKVAKSISGKMLLIKRKFVNTIIKLVKHDFFLKSESSEKYGAIKESLFRDLVSAAYDLRSRYVHTGIPFGNWICRNTGGINNEIQIGKPVLEDKELSKIIAKAPTYIGLERIIRYCLLQFAKLNGVYIEPNEDEKSKNELTWNNDTPWVNSIAKELLTFLKDKYDKVNIQYNKSYINVNIDENKAYWFCKRAKPTSALYFTVKDEEKAEAIKKRLETASIDYKYNQKKDFILNVDVELIKKNVNLFNEIYIITNKV